MRIRYICIRIDTDKGPFGVDLPLENGLCIIRAENSMGKSTCMRSVLVALGMEAAITTNQSDLPLPPVLKKELLTDDGSIASVLEANIFIEIENTKLERIVVRRTIKGERDRSLIEVTHGPALSNPTKEYVSEDYFVSRPGAASREKGFHTFLGNFLNWELPLVHSYENRVYPLYLQYIFPYFMVDQILGWKSIEPPAPSHFRIRESHKRVIEFLLKMDALSVAARRLELASKESDLLSKWSNIISQIRGIVQSAGAIIQRLPTRPIPKWPPEMPPLIVFPKDENWVPLSFIRQELITEIKKLANEEIPTVAEVVGITEKELNEAQENLLQKENFLARLNEILECEKGQYSATQTRIQKIEEDLQRNKDVKTLLNLGSEYSTEISKHMCPTCHQHIEDTLLPLAKEQVPMSIDDNIKFLQDQHRTFSAVLQNSSGIIQAREQQLSALREEITTLRSHIRALRQTLISDGRLPSRAAIRKHVETEEKLGRINQCAESVEMQYVTLEDISAAWSELQIEKKKLPDEDTTQTDHNKLNAWSACLQSQLQEFDFKSLLIDHISISHETYRAIHDGFDLPSNISASDFIRVIWGNLHGLLEISRKYETNHPGLLFFDEPKQQSAKDLSFERLLKRAAKSMEYGQQVIFATSEKEENLRKMLDGISHTYHGFKGHVIGPILKADGNKK